MFPSGPRSLAFGPTQHCIEIGLIEFFIYFIAQPYRFLKTQRRMDIRCRRRETHFGDLEDTTQYAFDSFPYLLPLEISHVLSQFRVSYKGVHFLFCTPVSFRFWLSSFLLVSFFLHLDISIYICVPREVIRNG